VVMEIVRNNDAGRHSNCRVPPPMRRRHLLAGMLAFFAGSYGRTSQAKDFAVPNAAPEKIRLIPDGWHIRNVGQLSDGRLFFVDSQLDSVAGITRDFVCTFLFDRDGHLVGHSIELIGARGKYPDGSVADALSRHLMALGRRTPTDIWVRPFSVQSSEAMFGLVPRRTESGEWRVEFMPGNTLSFYPPWEAGEYDT
jgi:hypothetical protein